MSLYLFIFVCKYLFSILEDMFLVLIFEFLVLQFGPVEGVIFADYGTDLGSGPTVPGKFLHGLAESFFIPQWNEWEYSLI